MSETLNFAGPLNKLVEALHRYPEIEVAWLYGSRAKGNSAPESDYDLALAFCPEHIGDFELLDDIRYQLQQFSANPLSVVDINRIPVPLALNVVETGELLLCRSDLRLRQEQQRIWSLWESYEHQHEKYRTEL